MNKSRYTFLIFLFVGSLYLNNSFAHFMSKEEALRMGLVFTEDKQPYYMIPMIMFLVSPFLLIVRNYMTSRNKGTSKQRIGLRILNVLFTLAFPLVVLLKNLLNGNESFWDILYFHLFEITFYMILISPIFLIIHFYMKLKNKGWPEE